MAKLRKQPTTLKSTAWMKEQYENPKYCILEDCSNEITPYKGAGQDVLCHVHQRECVEYGGMGKPERPHTFYRGWECNTCGYDPREDPAIQEIEDPYHQLRVARGVMHGDHIKLKSQGGKDTAENINTLCCRCHMIKTYKEQDYLGTKKVDA